MDDNEINLGSLVVHSKKLEACDMIGRHTGNAIAAARKSARYKSSPQFRRFGISYQSCRKIGQVPT
jgi:hypothetical protein